MKPTAQSTSQKSFSKKLFKPLLFIALIVVGVSWFMLNVTHPRIQLPLPGDYLYPITILSVGYRLIDDPCDISVILTALGTARRTGPFSWVTASSEQPPDPNRLRISYPSDRTYLFTHGGQDRVWVAYRGVYRISEANARLIRQFASPTVVIP